MTIAERQAIHGRLGAVALDIADGLTFLRRQFEGALAALPPNTDLGNHPALINECLNLVGERFGQALLLVEQLRKDIPR